MKHLSIRDLHIQTGHWVRKAQRSGAPIVVTDRGRPVAVLTAYDMARVPRGLPRRSHLPKIAVDSADVVAEVRERGERGERGE